VNTTYTIQRRRAMDKKECLEKCAKMWFWMMLHPKQEKQNYFPIPNVDGDVYNSCYCCEYISPKGELPLICSQCLLLDLWVGKMQYEGDDCACQTYPDSPYRPYYLSRNRWTDDTVTNKDAMAIALGAFKIWKFCRKKLRLMEKEK
jgi:hypothetical protein